MRYSPARPRLDLRSRLTPAVMWILALTVGAFLLWLFSGKAVQAQIATWLALRPESLLQGHFWKLVTTAFIPPSAIAFVIDALMLFFFVPILEREWGTRRFIVFAVAATLIANGVAALVGLAVSPGVPIGGLSALILASIAAFGTAFARQQVQFFGVLPMKGRTLSLVILGFLFVSVLLNREWANGAGYLAAMAFAWAFTGGRFTPRTWLLRIRHYRLKKRLSVLEGGGRRPKKRDWLN